MRRDTKILIAEPLDFSPAALAVLQRVGDVELRECRREDFAAAFAEYDVIWFRLAFRIDERTIGSRPRCRILATPVTGLDHIDLDACDSQGVRVVSLRGETEFLKNVRATAELTIGLTLSLLRRIPSAHSAARQGNWDRDSFRGRELFGRTVGIVGMGRLGTLVAGYFKAFGTRVIGYDPRDDYPTEAAERVPQLDDLLAQSDIVVLLVKYEESTRGLIARAEFAKMKPGAVLINTSRGGVVDEPALLAALDSGRLAGAALDVLDGEPAISADHAIVSYAHDHDNVLLTPHIGGNTMESFEKTEAFLAEKVVQAIGDRTDILVSETVHD
ncbi:MAG TPA: NAD(P)-dependent oxidoreductase [Pirellulales bacterium]|nr:NAD(P)-dependent oxidoreductase [Pirellulales bacterium]